MIRIITDSLCDLTMDYAKELNIDIMPLTVRFGEDDFKCGIDLTNEAFYDKLTNDSNNPSTAAVNPFEFEEIFKKYIDAGEKSWQSFFQIHECNISVRIHCSREYQF